MRVLLASGGFSTARNSMPRDGMDNQPSPPAPPTMSTDSPAKKSHHHFIWWAVVLVVIWVVLRVALALTSVALHLLWIGAIIFAIVWVMRQFRRGSRT